jgi:uncharacterized membrane protein (DUF441 family)
MVNLFRLSVTVALVSLLVGLVLPFDRPMQISVDLNKAPPPWLLLSAAFLAVALLSAVASGALLFFRLWGRWLGAIALVGGVFVAWLASGSVLTASMSSLAISLFGLSASAFAVGFGLSWHPIVAPRFRHER